ncbi:ribonucleotide reductase of class Ia (aerobic), alpha subunit [Acidovorax phage ACP17]|uniref:Ribonucleoside-diphosphate reductase n=1 Tax=Acidovorax phage ACP17 TaxID=2010329 RepID=A0A218M3A0_9CAUD|nr:ribonucleotide reductase of class Ia (aerobic), alpha subunit [Acidovorax phage ACP17]ASD50517.1 ribonucleotide reductase of class Ia (aerobic), alpha subunit [Acidovorax phage ACP17]
MIETIIKRNGKQEPFSPAKLNGWGEWSAKTLGPGLDWGGGVLHAVSVCPKVCTSEKLNEELEAYFNGLRTYEGARMAGRLYAARHPKRIYGSKKKPTVRELHTELFDAGLMVWLNYSVDEYEYAQSIIDHSRDLKMTYGMYTQMRFKYALRNKISGKEYETPQFVYMRMAMALAEDFEGQERLDLMKDWYDYYSGYKINPPTPFFTNLGTKLNGYASCCLYTTLDTWRSLLAGNVIAGSMTALSAGIGSSTVTRSIGDPIRGGMIVHQGKVPYYRANVGQIGANLQNGRGGAQTEHYTCFDPEVETLQRLKNPMTPASKQVRGLDYSFGSNKVFARAVAQNKEYALFSYLDEPELHEAMYQPGDTFEKLYAEYCASGRPKKWLNARSVLISAIDEAFETGRHYLHMFDEMNTHTPFKDPIRSSNLCQEIKLPTKGFESPAQLYEEWNESHGEIALCNIGGVIVSNIKNDEEYRKATYLALLAVDVSIYKSHYEFPTLRHTATSRMNAGIGVLGLAHLMAMKKQRWDTQEGRNFIHDLFETHYWFLTEASLKIGRMRGNAPWMHKTKWPDGWLPLDTYNRNVDSLVTVGNKRDWESRRAEIVANGGLGHSVLAAHMPGESSTIAAGTTNGPYPIRDFDLVKTNGDLAIYWVAPDSTELREHYQLAYDVPTECMLWNYAIMQKWTDQTISADLWKRLQGTTKIGTKEMVNDYLTMVKYGVETRYYINSLTAKGVKLETEVKATPQPIDDTPPEDTVCESCAL